MKLLSFKLVVLLLTILSYLPLRVLYVVSDFLYIVLYHLIKYRREVVHSNLKNSFPEKTESEIKAVEKEYYSYLADLMVESIKSITISEREIKERFTIENLHLITDELNNGNPLIAISGHYGNWEWGALRIALAFDQKTLVVYKPLTDKWFDDYINKVRAKFGTEMVSMRNTLRKIAAYRNEPHLLVLVGDQTPPHDQIELFIPFLNQPTPVFLGAEKIASRLNYPVVYFSINRLKRGYYECSILPLIDQSTFPGEHAVTYAHTRMLENDIQRDPSIWLWSHKRWKYKPKVHS